MSGGEPKMEPRLPFETSVVGSLPRPQWVQDLVLDESAHSGIRRNLTDKAVGFAIAMQEAAGVDVVTDGEWRRYGYVEFMAQRLSGFEPVEGRLGRYRAVSRLQRRQPILLDDVRFLKQHAHAGAKATLPSPYHMVNHRGFEFTPAYKDRESFLEDIVHIVAAEVTDLAGSGVDVIQLDDPRILALTLDHTERNMFVHGRGDLDYEMGLARDSLARVTAHATGVRTAVHVCRGNTARRVVGVGGYESLMPYLHELPCDQILMEYSVPEAGDLSALRDFPADKLLGLGVTDVRSTEVSSVEDVVARVEAAIEYVDTKRITLNPDCGFAPSMANPIPLDEAYQKLKVQSEAAQELRRRFV